MKHATAVENFMEHLGPERFADGVFHKLLVGFRPLLVSLLLRTPLNCHAYCICDVLGDQCYKQSKENFPCT
jgi:hypothetical protein